MVKPVSDLKPPIPRANMKTCSVTSLLIFGTVKVTAATAEDVIKEADRLVTLTKKEDKMNAKREAARFVRNVKVSADSDKTAMDVLFNELGPRFANRNGGYTRQLKLGNRKGDNAPVVVVTWVD